MIVPYNALLYLALIRPLFCIGAIVKGNIKSSFYIYITFVERCPKDV